MTFSWCFKYFIYLSYLDSKHEFSGSKAEQLFTWVRSQWHFSMPQFPTGYSEIQMYMQNVGLPHSRETLKLWISKLTKDGLHTSFFPSEEGDLIFLR